MENFLCQELTLYFRFRGQLLADEICLGEYRSNARFIPVALCSRMKCIMRAKSKYKSGKMPLSFDTSKCKNIGCYCKTTY